MPPRCVWGAQRCTGRAQGRPARPHLEAGARSSGRSERRAGVAVCPSMLGGWSRPWAGCWATMGRGRRALGRFPGTTILAAKKLHSRSRRIWFKFSARDPTKCASSRPRLTQSTVETKLAKPEARLRSLRASGEAAATELAGLCAPTPRRRWLCTRPPHRLSPQPRHITATGPLTLPRCRHYEPSVPSVSTMYLHAGRADAAASARGQPAAEAITAARAQGRARAHILRRASGVSL